MKRKHGCRAFGLVDVGKLREKEMIHTADDSLAKKIETENELARSYVDYLLGRVICCDNVEQLRSYKTAITSEGMLYQGYVARALRRDLMEDVLSAPRCRTSHQTLASGIGTAGRGAKALETNI